MRFAPLAALVVCAPAVLAQTGVDAWIAKESPIAQAGLLANIGSNGAKAYGAKPGIVVASPSKSNPDYFYTWTRDSSLVFKALIDQLVLGLDTSVRALVDDFIGAEAILQQVQNPSGSVTSGGLGEPKFNADETQFNGAWGRPQRDGPALRATAMITYANWLLDNKNATAETLWPIIELDLNYVAADWNQTTFDLWEEVQGSSFFTTAVQHRALREGSALATRLGQTSVVETYDTQADNILCFLQSYWNPTGNYMTANTNSGRSGHDANVVLTSTHTWDIEAGCDAVTYQPCSDKALASLKAYVDVFRSIYKVNNGIAVNAAVATGRYPEDGYMGGNPWYLTTLAVAEQLYDALTTWTAVGSLNVTDVSLAFFRQFAPSIATGIYASDTDTYTALIPAIKDFADGFIAVVAEYTPADGSLSEQYSRSDGRPVSALDLTWSYASALTAFEARAGIVTKSWGAKGLTVPSVCQRNTGGGGGGGGGGTVSVTFNVDAKTVWGENIYITGSVDQLQNWSPNNAMLLSAAKYPIWSITVDLPASSNIQYKYIRKYNGRITWESDPNMQITTPASGSYTANDQWR